jgi:predicted transcriptional regulator
MKHRTGVFLNEQWIDVITIICDAGPEGIMPSLIAERTGLSAQNLNYYLNTMEINRIIAKTPLGRNRFVTVNKEKLIEIQHEISQIFNNLLDMSEGKAQTHESTKNTVIRPSWDGKDIVHNDGREQGTIS